MAQEQVVKAKKRQWYPIIAPKQFNNVVIGDTLVYEPQSMIGKTLSHSLMHFTNDIKRQNINIHFKVTEVEGDNARTTIVGYEILPSSIKRFVRRNSEKMDISFTCDTADNVFLRVKPLIISRAEVKGSVASKVRNSSIVYLTKTIKKMTYEEVLNELIIHKLQSGMREALSKIYPLKVCEIKYLGIEKREKKNEATVQAVAAPQEAASEEVPAQEQ